MSLPDHFKRLRDAERGILRPEVYIVDESNLPTPEERASRIVDEVTSWVHESPPDNRTFPDSPRVTPDLAQPRPPWTWRDVAGLSVPVGLFVLTAVGAMTERPEVAFIGALSLVAWVIDAARA